MYNTPEQANSRLFKKFIPGIVWFILLLVLICLPGSDLPEVDNWLNIIYFDKWVHAVLFAVLVFLFIYPVVKLEKQTEFKKNTALKIALAACIWGLTTEFIQKFFVAGREFDILDWAADTFGITVTYIFCNKKYLS